MKINMYRKFPINGIYLIAGEVAAQDGSELDTTPNVFTLTVTGFADRGVPSLAGTVALPRTGQTKSYAPGDDGAIQAGVAWPTPRFVDNGDGTVTDNLTGLMWLKDANCFGRETWQSALDTVADFNANPGKYSCQGYTASYTDWRLPNRKELHSLTDFSKYNPALPSRHPFANVQAYWYWSSTTYANSTDRAWLVSMRHGFVDNDNKDLNYYVWPVSAGR